MCVCVCVCVIQIYLALGLDLKLIILVIYYNNICTYIHSPLSTEDLGNENGFDSFVEMSEVDEGASHKENDFDVSEAMKLINNSNSRRVSSKAHSAPKDAYFSFLLLRHLRIRDLKNKVRCTIERICMALYTA